LQNFENADELGAIRVTLSGLAFATRVLLLDRKLLIRMRQLALGLRHVVARRSRSSTARAQTSLARLRDDLMPAVRI
jgi:hypothetical protein